MVRCKAGEILRREAYFMYAAATKGEAERRRWPFIASLGTKGATATLHRRNRSDQWRLRSITFSVVS